MPLKPRETLNQLSQWLNETRGAADAPVDVWTFNDYETNTNNPNVNPLPLVEHAKYKYLVR